MKTSLLILSCFAFTSCPKQEQQQAPVEDPSPWMGEPVVADVPEIYRPFFNHGDEDLEVVRASLPFDSISLARTPCEGDCPVYEIVFHRDGRAEFNAQEHLPKIGKFVGRVRFGSYGRLCYLIENSHFNDLKTNYRASWTDAATCIVTVKRGSREKKVSDYGSVGPIELWAIQQLIDAIKDKTEWTPAK